MSEHAPGTDFGHRLRQAREARGITLRQIATTTKISLAALEGLERNDISKLPGGLFSRAFVRSYAQEVGLDPDETVREFLAAFDEEGVTAGTPPFLLPRRKDTGEDAFDNQRRVAGTVLKLVLVSVPLGAALLYFSTRGGPAVSPAGTQPAAAARSAPSSRPPVTAVEPGSEPDAPAEAAIREGATAPTAAPEPEAPVPPQAVPVDVSGAAASTEGIQVEVAPTGRCWVSLTVDGTLVLERVMEPGERVSRRVVTEAVIRVGDAGAFAFSVNGRPGRPLGEDGLVRTVRITPDTFETLLR